MELNKIIRIAESGEQLLIFGVSDDGALERGTSIARTNEIAGDCTRRPKAISIGALIVIAVAICRYFRRGLDFLAGVRRRCGSDGPPSESSG